MHVGIQTRVMRRSEWSLCTKKHCGAQRVSEVRIHGSRRRAVVSKHARPHSSTMANSPWFEWGEADGWPSEGCGRREVGDWANRECGR